MLGLLKKRKTKGSTILIVDDEPDIRSTISLRLESKNYKVLTANNGQNGLEEAKKHHPDLILLDTSMPVLNGHQMLEQLRSDSDIRDIPVIMVTALSDAHDIEVASSFGVSDYVTKPFNFIELLNKIEEILSKK